MSLLNHRNLPSWTSSLHCICKLDQHYFLPCPFLHLCFSHPCYFFLWVSLTKLGKLFLFYHVPSLYFSDLYDVQYISQSSLVCNWLHFPDFSSPVALHIPRSIRAFNFYLPFKLRAQEGTTVVRRMYCCTETYIESCDVPFLGTYSS
jgi:hypothetical protein